MARGIIRKMIRGAAEAGVPMLQEQHRNNILQNRETAMARIQNQYRTQDREAEQSFTADQNAMDREQRAGERPRHERGVGGGFGAAGQRLHGGRF